MANTILSQDGQEEIEVLVHGASNLHTKRKDDTIPRAFVSLKSEHDFIKNIPSKSSTTVAQSSHNPCWGEVVVFKYTAGNEIIAILSIIDYDTKEVIGKFRIPSKRLKPFVQYHLELIDQMSSCFISIKRKIHLLDSRSLEFVLCEMTEEVSDRDLDGFLAIFRPVPDILTFRSKYMHLLFEGQQRTIIEFQPIDLYIESPTIPKRSVTGFPQTIPISFKVSKATHVRHSWWHNVILCSRYIDDLFQPASGCFIELYRNSMFEECSSELVLRSPYAYAEIPLQEIEKIILQKLPAGVTFTNVSFRQIKLDRPVLPKLKVAFRAVPKNTSTQLQPCSIAQLIAIDELSLLNLRMGSKNSSASKKSKRVGQDKAENAVADLLARAYTQREPEYDIRDLSPLPSPSADERQQRALVRMSADLLAERQKREKLEDDKFDLTSQLSKVRRDHNYQNTLIVDGLQHAEPDEIASKFILLREKHRRLSDENELLKTRLRETNETIIKTDGKQNSMVRELKLATEESDRYLEEMGRLSKRLKDQKKLEDLCKEQEKIISKLEDLFSKTRINIDSRWKDDVDRMITMTRTRERYNPDLYNIPFYTEKPASINPQILNVQEEIESERYRAHMLERQVNKMAREHAREKQDLINRLEDVKLGYGNGRIYDKGYGEDERGESRNKRF